MLSIQKLAHNQCYNRWPISPHITTFLPVRRQLYSSLSMEYLPVGPFFVYVSIRFEFHPPVLHLGQATRYRMLWLFPTVCLCGLIEVLGWSGRLWSSFSPLLSTPFQIQCVQSALSSLRKSWRFGHRITSTIIAPTPLLAVNFVVLGEIIKRLGSQYSRLSPKWCMFLRLSFLITCD